jgi:membrane protein YdbS with pleckstrin-like domain
MTSNADKAVSGRLHTGDKFQFQLKGMGELSGALTIKNVIQMLIGMLSLIIITMIGTTWIFAFSTEQTTVLLSLFQIPVVAELIFAMIIIPIRYRSWIKNDHRE